MRLIPIVENILKVNQEVRLQHLATVPWDAEFFLWFSLPLMKKGMYVHNKYIQDTLI